ncbi:hypothetical protein [Stieleria neptunia]|nr:hypothetical protein [Stieleria neptunia]
MSLIVPTVLPTEYGCGIKIAQMCAVPVDGIGYEFETRPGDDQAMSGI